ncbi:MAG: phosphate propanoyltransferase [Chitinivibrionales bacterium]|nr:phosphate propanoyltransferase [Chitinivibrionales bacterium]
MAIAIDRKIVENVVREVIMERLSGQIKSAAQKPATRSPLRVNASVRHIHLTQAHLEALFGPGAKLTVQRPLYQTGHFASEQTLTIIGPKSRLISNVRILGPVRPYSQVELAYTDTIMLGINKVPVRMSGDIAGTPGAWLMGPAGMLELKEGVIRAVIHAHMGTADADYYGVKNKEIMKLHVHSDAPVVFTQVHVRVDPAFKLEVHCDTDEANACNLCSAKSVELTK